MVATRTSIKIPEEEAIGVELGHRRQAVMSLVLGQGNGVVVGVHYEEHAIGQGQWHGEVLIEGHL